MAGEKISTRILMKVANCTKESLRFHKAGEWKHSSRVEIKIGGTYTEWSFMVFPNGLYEEDKTNLSLCLRVQKVSGAKFDVNWRLGIVGRSEKDNFVTGYWNDTFKDFQYGGLGCPKLISHEELLKETRGLVVQGAVTFFCDLTFKPRKQKLTQSLINQELATDFQKMFEDNLFTDFKFITYDGVLTAHKAVLAARSPVFYSMLTNDMQEANENMANVLDFDSRTITELLRFIYCNEVESLDVVARDLVYAAEKYQLDKLKDMCVESIISTLSVQNVLKSLVIAYRISESENFFDECVDVIVRNFDAISKTKMWIELPKDCLLETFEKVRNQLMKQSSYFVFVEPF